MGKKQKNNMFLKGKNIMNYKDTEKKKFVGKNKKPEDP